ncbi:MAG TPA: OmpH family outer membrane protein [Terriglobales bacterium]|nr:OmpH family outer membrane protein [Terriglobales bacterium]
MKSKFTRTLLAMAFVVSVAALAQTGSAAAASPAAAPAATGPGTKIGTISMEQAIFATNEGRRDFEALSKKLEPKQNELKGQNDEIESLQKQLSTQGDKLNEDARANLVKQIEGKKKSLDRQLQDAREDAQNQQNEIAQRILQKLGPVLIKYATDNGFGMIVDTSQPWPQSPVVWWGESVDVTKPVVDVYNAQSGVAPPPSTGATKPATPAKPAGTGVKPTTPPVKPAEPPK